MLDFSFTDEQEMLRDTVRRLMQREAGDAYLQELDDEYRYPHELYDTWVEAGLLGLPFPAAYGGADGGVIELVIVAEEIGRRGYDLTGVYGTPLFNGLNILHHGDQQQRDRLLPALIRGELRFCIAITEPGAGSDAGALRTTARQAGGTWVLNGEKVFTSGAGVPGSVISVYARSDPAADHRQGISCFLVPNDHPGVTVRPMRMLGRHMYPTTQVLLDDVVVGDDAVLGPVHGGWDVMLSGLRLERLVAAAAYLGNSQTVLDEALDYAKQREQFGRRIGDHQVIAHMLADMRTGVEAARLLTYAAAWALARGDDALEQISMAKLFGSETFLRVANDGMQILGGYGYSMEVPMQRHLRAARGATITAGTSQMQRQVIARRMGLRPS